MEAMLTLLSDLIFIYIGDAGVTRGESLSKSYSNVCSQ